MNEYLTERGVLFHGANYQRWLCRVRAVMQRKSKIPAIAQCDVERQILAMARSAKHLKIVLSLISKALLDRIPEDHTKSIELLLDVLPDCSQTFRLMRLPPELRLRIYRASDLPTKFEWSLSTGPRLKYGWQLTRVSTTTRREVLPEMYPQLAVYIRGAWFKPTIFAQDCINFLTQFSVLINLEDDCLFIKLTVTPGTALRYELGATSRHEIVTFADIDPTGEFQSSLDASCRKQKLDVIAPGYRGKRLACLAVKVSRIYGNIYPRA